MNTNEQVKTYAVEAIVKVPNYRGKRFRGITRAVSEDAARTITRNVLFNSLRRAIIAIEMRNIRIDKINVASDFYIDEKQLEFKNQ